MKNQSEEELAKHFIDFFRDQDLYFEVPAAGIIDIVVKTGIITTAIEVKTSFNFSVLEQAIKNCNFANYSYVAVPKASLATRNFQKKLCKDYGVGILEYNPGKYTTSAGRVEELLKPRLNRKIYKLKLHEYHKESVAGSISNRITAFGNYVRMLKEYISCRPKGSPIDEVFRVGFVHYSSVYSFKSCLARHISDGTITGVRIEKGVIYPDKQQSA